MMRLYDAAILMPSGTVTVSACVSPTLGHALEMVMDELRKRQPRATDAQRLDMIFTRGLVGMVDDYNLPRVGSNEDEDA